MEVKAQVLTYPERRFLVVEFVVAYPGYLAVWG